MHPPLHQGGGGPKCSRLVGGWHGWLLWIHPNPNPRGTQFFERDTNPGPSWPREGPLVGHMVYHTSKVPWTPLAKSTCLQGVVQPALAVHTPALARVSRVSRVASPPHEPHDMGKASLQHVWCVHACTRVGHSVCGVANQPSLASGFTSEGSRTRNEPG